MSSYKFRILVDTDSSEEIFRDIIISEADNFESLYNAIIQSFGFNGDQLASFYLSNDSWDKGLEIALMDMGSGEGEEELKTMKNTSLNELVDTQGQKIILVYDFLKMWCFLIELIEITPEFTLNPEIKLSIGVAPSEDSKELDFSSDMGMGSPSDLGNDFDDIFSEFDDDDDMPQFENLDDFDI